MADQWFENESKLEPSKRIGHIKSIVRKMSGVIGDPYCDPFCEYFRVTRIMDMGGQLVRSLRTIWTQMREAWAAVKPIDPTNTQKPGYSYMMNRGERSIPWNNLTGAVETAENSNVKSMLFVLGDGDSKPRLFTKMGQAWAMASFKDGRGHWRLHLEPEQGDRLFRRDKRDLIPRSVLVVNLFEDKEENKGCS
jgi:hypothetical protein